LDPSVIRAKKDFTGQAGSTRLRLLRTAKLCRGAQDKEDIGQKAESSRSKIRRFLEGSKKKGDASENVDHSVYRPSS